MGIKESLDDASNVYLKENLLMVAINELMESNGWKLMEENYAPSEFFSYFAKEGSPVKHISIKASALGNMLKVNFIAERDSRNSVEDILDSNIYEISKSFNVGMYVSDDIELVNLPLMQHTVSAIISEFEEKLV